MARELSLSILETDETKAMLAEKYSSIIDDIEKTTISAQLKNTELSGDPDSGSVEAKRMANTDSEEYGTARSGGKGKNIKATSVTVNSDTNREIINEVEEKDLRLYGVKGFIDKKAESNKRSMKRELERAFFKCANTEGTAATLKASPINEKVEELIQLIETTENEYVDGVERDLINVICSPAVYGQLRNFLDTGTNNANVDTSEEECGMFHKVKVRSSVYLPEKVDMIGMCTGSVAQPVSISIDEPGKIPLSDAYHFGLFFYYGTKAVMPDLIYTVASAA